MRKNVVPEPNYLLVDGAGGSGTDHWFAKWEVDLPNTSRVEQSDWNGGTLNDWTDALNKNILSLDGAVILIAHSMGCILVSHWCRRYSGKVAGAMLVAPADVDGAWVERESLYSLFSPIPTARLPFPSYLIADPYIELARAQWLADQWGSRFRTVGNAGHIGSDSQLGDWQQGRELLKELICDCSLTSNGQSQ